MAKFRYAMQNILDIKIKLEDQSKQEFSAARAALDEEEERLSALFDRKRTYEEREKSLLEGTLNIREIDENKTAILCMENFIIDQRERVELAERNLEKAREKMTGAMKERKTHESLKEKAFEQFLTEEKRQEGKEIDELTSYTYGQRRKGGNRDGAPAGA